MTVICDGLYIYIYRSQCTTKVLPLLETHSASPFLSLFSPCRFSLKFSNFYSYCISFLYTCFFLHTLFSFRSIPIVIFLAFSHSLFRVVYNSLCLLEKRDTILQRVILARVHIGLIFPYRSNFSTRTAEARTRTLHVYVYTRTHTYTHTATACMCATHFSQSGVTAHFSYPKWARLWNTSDVT